MRSDPPKLMLKLKRGARPRLRLSPRLMPKLGIRPKPEPEPERRPKFKFKLGLELNRPGSIAVPCAGAMPSSALRRSRNRIPRAGRGTGTGVDPSAGP